ncbi:MAG: hypothetical protein KDC49_06210 [Saprospiraceae bacterium]|nr:hypothetical protein [Saprospiraceae bacterium]
MNNFFFLLALIWCLIAQATTVRAQDSIRHELAVNATNLLANIFSLKNENLSSPYVLNYKLFLPKGTGFRFGGGFSYDDDDNGSVQGVRAESTSYDLRAGFEKSVKISKGLYFVPSLDFLFGGKTVESSANGFGLTTSESKIGAGPALRLVYVFKSRISLMTEVPLYYIKTSGERAEFDPVQGPSSVNFTEQSLMLNEPKVLFIGITF